VAYSHLQVALAWACLFSQDKENCSCEESGLGEGAQGKVPLSDHSTCTRRS
jgi:hypothetical protein